MKIGILGLTFHAGNKGCEALSYSFLEILNDIAEKRRETATVVFITVFPTKLWIKNKFSFSKIKKMYYPSKKYSNISFECAFFLYKKGKIIFLNSLKECKCVFDYTAGDSFTDIYGLERFYSRTKCKKAVIDSGVPLVLGSQTIGPFNDEQARETAAEVIKGAYEVYARDEMSQKYTFEISGRKPKLTSDIAFALPYSHDLSQKKKDKVQVGFNPSGLLWNGGYTQNNQFNLSVDYPEYCRRVIRELTKSCDVHIIPHAFSSNYKSMDNDLIAAESLHNEFPDTILEASYSTPMEIKSYIAGMDVFVGARMHAAIGAFSAGVPVIPFSYSRKFEGLFNSLNYNYVISGTKDSTDLAVEKTLDFIKQRDKLKSSMTYGREKTEESNKYISDEIERLIYG